MRSRIVICLRQTMTVFGFFGRVLLSIRAGAWIRAPTRLAVVGGRVGTRPYKAGGRRRARGYAPLQGGRSSAGAWIRAPTRLVIVGGRVDTRPYKQQSSAGLGPPGSWGRVPIDPPRSDAQRWGAAVFLLFRFERGPERVSSR